MRLKAEHLMGALVLALVAVMFLSGRPVPPQNLPRIEAIETLPDGAKLAKVRRFTEYGSGILPYTKLERMEREKADWNRQPLKLGFSYREVTFAALPIIAYREYGLVTYLEEPGGYRIAILQPKQVELLQELTGRDYSGYSFPYWKHLWGWLFVIGFIVAACLYFLEEARRREELGIY